MKAIVVIIVSFFFVSLAFCPLSFARGCSTDLDCDMYGHERCVVPPSDTVGVCVKSEPRREKERKPVFDTPAPSPLKSGQFCMTDKDCESGQSCVRKENALSGTCH